MEQRACSPFCPVTMSVDNDQALYRGSNHTLNITTKDQHFDILWCIHKSIRLLRTEINIELVHGHMDRTTPVHLLPRPNQLNIECDAMARHIRENYSTHPSIQPSLHLPHESYSIWTGGRKLYRDVNSTLHVQAFYIDARKYYTPQISLG